MTTKTCGDCGVEVDARGFHNHKGSNQCIVNQNKYELKAKGFKKVNNQFRSFMLRREGYNVVSKPTRARTDGNLVRQSWAKHEDIKEIKNFIDENYVSVFDRSTITLLKKQHASYFNYTRKGILVNKEDYDLFMDMAKKLPNKSNSRKYDKVLDTNNYIVVKIDSGVRDDALVFKKDEQYRGSKMKNRKFKIYDAETIEYGDHLSTMEQALFNLDGKRVGMLADEEEAKQIIKNNHKKVCVDLL